MITPQEMNRIANVTYARTKKGALRWELLTPTTIYVAFDKSSLQLAQINDGGTTIYQFSVLNGSGEFVGTMRTLRGDSDSILAKLYSYATSELLLVDETLEDVRRALGMPPPNNGA